MKVTPRFFHIDILRFLATIVMIATHVLSLHFGSPGIFTIWNYLHFAVVGFVFCSAYVYASRPPSDSMSFFLWYKKRFVRLYIPYFIYLVTHYALWLLFPHMFRGYDLQGSPDYFFSSMMLTGGVGIGWLPLLFLQLSLLFPLLRRVAKNRYALWTGVLLLIGFTAITTFMRIPQEYSRSIAWLPWSLVIILGFAYADLEKRALHKVTAQLLVIAMIVSGAAFLGLNTILAHRGAPLVLTLHKYPPDIFYLSFGMCMTSLLHILFHKNIRLPQAIERFITYVSANAYGIFFIHIIVLDFVSTTLHVSYLLELALVFIILISIMAIVQMRRVL